MKVESSSLFSLSEDTNTTYEPDAEATNGIRATRNKEMQQLLKLQVQL